MKLKRTTPGTFLSASLIVLITIGLFAATARAAMDGNPYGGSDDRPVVSDLLANTDTADTETTSTDLKETVADRKSSMSVNPMSITHESADILHYEDGSPYIHDILTNNTDRAIIATQYCMLAYNKNGMPLKLHWNFLDSSAESTFENIVRSRENILSDQTEEYRGGWSLYDGEIVESLPKTKDWNADQAAYTLLCLKQVIFEDGTVWNNPDYENWFQTYAGREIAIDELQNHYPHVYRIKAD